MASQLAQTAKTFRAVLVGFIAFFILYIVFTQIFTVISKVVISRQPKKLEPPSVAFGKLPKLALKSLALTGEAPNYSLETTTGTLPQLPAKISIYKFVEPQASFLSLERTKNLAKKLGFVTLPKDISPSLYFWQEENKSLRANTVTGNFEIDSDISQITLSVGDLPSPGEIKSMTKGYMDGKGLLRSGFEIGSQEVVLIKKNGSTLSKAISLSETSLAKIDFFRGLKAGDDNTIPVLPQNPKKGLIELYYVGGSNFPKVKYTVWDFDFEKGETYPLRSISSTWEDIKNNRGFITYLQHQGSDSLESLNSLSLLDIYIRKIYLAYFDDENIQNFLQPIYVFEGDGKDGDGQAVDISIYLPAVDPSWIE